MDEGSATKGSDNDSWLVKMILLYIYFVKSHEFFLSTVGAPIEVVHCPIPSKEQVDEVHSQFCKQLTQLFEDHKSKYITDAERVHMKIV